jgi:hypothetical protein
MFMTDSTVLQQELLCVVLTRESWEKNLSKLTKIDKNW